MNKKVLSLIALIFISLTRLIAQDDNKLVLKGIVIDAVTKEPIAFANLGLLGTVTGVASNVDGQFELSIPLTYSTHTVRISAVGYGVRDLKAYEIKDIPNGQIALKPISYSIGTVNVVGELLTYKKMINDVVKAIDQNYINVPHNYKGYYKESIQNGLNNPKIKEGIVTVYDHTGYKRTNVSETFDAINYLFTEIKRNYEVESVKDGLMLFDEILLSDVVRNTRNILDLSNSKDYRFQNKGRLMYEGDSIQIIGFNAFKPTASNSGTDQALQYEGELYINTKDKAVLKNITRIKTTGTSSLGRNFIALDKEADEPVAITIVSNYKKIDQTYFLSGVSVDYTYKDNEANSIVKSCEFITTSINRKNPKPIKGRCYYEKLPENNAFWNNYSIYFEGEEL